MIALAQASPVASLCPGKQPGASSGSSTPVHVTLVGCDHAGEGQGPSQVQESEPAGSPTPAVQEQNLRAADIGRDDIVAESLQQTDDSAPEHVHAEGLDGPCTPSKEAPDTGIDALSCMQQEQANVLLEIASPCHVHPVLDGGLACKQSGDVRQRSPQDMQGLPPATSPKG